MTTVLNNEQIQLSFSINNCLKDKSYLVEFSLDNSDKEEPFQIELIKKQRII